MRTVVLAIVSAALLLGAPPTLASDLKETVPRRWYRGDEDSKLRLGLRYGPAGIVLKAPLKKAKVVELRFEIRF